MYQVQYPNLYGIPGLNMTNPTNYLQTLQSLNYNLLYNNYGTNFQSLNNVSTNNSNPNNINSNEYNSGIINSFLDNVQTTNIDAISKGKVDVQKIKEYRPKKKKNDIREPGEIECSNSLSKNKQQIQLNDKVSKKKKKPKEIGVKTNVIGIQKGGRVNDKYIHKNNITTRIIEVEYQSLSSNNEDEEEDSKNIDNSNKNKELTSNSHSNNNNPISKQESIETTINSNSFYNKYDNIGTNEFANNNNYLNTNNNNNNPLFTANNQNLNYKQIPVKNMIVNSNNSNSNIFTGSFNNNSIYNTSNNNFNQQMIMSNSTVDNNKKIFSEDNNEYYKIANLNNYNNNSNNINNNFSDKRQVTTHRNSSINSNNEFKQFCMLNPYQNQDILNEYNNNDYDEDNPYKLTDDEECSNLEGDYGNTPNYLKSISNIEMSSESNFKQNNNDKQIDNKVSSFVPYNNINEDVNENQNENEKSDEDYEESEYKELNANNIDFNNYYNNLLSQMQNSDLNEKYDDQKNN